MWSAYQSLKTYHRRPSDVLEVTDSIIAYCIDEVVLWFGVKIENMLSERINTGAPNDPRWEDKYTLAELLDSSFHPPKPLPISKTKPAESGFSAWMALAAQSGGAVKIWEYVKPN